VHRDIKPANIMLTEATGTGDHVRILDFGLAKLRVESGHLDDMSMATLAIGTPSYMPPEQARGEPVDVRSDVYSTGVMLFELLTGRKPFESDEAHEVLGMHARTPPPKLREVEPERGFSRALEEIVVRAMAKEPDARYASAAEMVEALDATPEATRARGEKPQVSSRSSPGQPMVSSPGRPSRLAYTETQAMSTEGASIDERSPRPRSRSRLWIALTAFGGLAVCAYFAYAQIHTSPSAGGTPDAGPIAASSGAASGPALRPTSSTAAPTLPPDAGSKFVVVTQLPPDAAPPEPDAAVLTIDLDGGEEALPPSEMHEPIAEVKPAPSVPEEQIDAKPTHPPPTPTPPTPTPKPRVDSTADAETLIAAGKREEAIAELERLRKSDPKSAYTPYLLGGLYFEKFWWSVGIEQYTVAIQNNHTYRHREVLIRNVIRAMSSNKTAKKAANLLHAIGGPAVPYLQAAQKSDPNKDVRLRAGQVLHSIRGR
jgi:serine/threonine-protein kinase